MEKDILNYFKRTFHKRGSQILSVSSLQKTVLKSSKQNKKLSNQKINKCPFPLNQNQMKVISPFYDRNKICKATNCHCPYHKKLKGQVLKKYQIRPHKGFISAIQSPVKNRQNTNQQKQRNTHKVQAESNQKKGKANSKWQKFKRQHKLSCFNIEFDNFLKGANQILLKKYEYEYINAHTIKNSVWEIFHYILDNLDKETQEMVAYLSNIEKDRDLKDFYIQRFQDLKRRRTRKQKEVQQKIISKLPQRKEKERQKSINKPVQIDQRRKTKRFKSEVMLMQKFIKHVQQGIQIDGEQIDNLCEFNMQRYEDNFNILKEAIPTMNFYTLSDIKQDIVLKIQKIILLRQPTEDNLRKRYIINEILEMINSRIQKLDDELQENYQKQSYDRISSSYSKSNKSQKGTSSFHREKRRNSKFCQLGKKQSILDSNFKKQRGSLDFDYQSQLQGEQKLKDSHNSPKRSQKSQQRINFDPHSTVIADGLKKTQRFKLAKHRKLSDDNLLSKSFLLNLQQQNKNNSKIMTMEELSVTLDTMSAQFEHKWKRIKQIERRISVTQLNKYIINDQDSLITAKRKIHLLKELIKQDMFQDNLKDEVRQYISLVEQYNLLKNKNWAQKKLKNIINIKNQEIQMSTAKEQPQNQLSKIVFDIFNFHNKLVYYDLLVTQYEQPQINMEKNLFTYIQRDLNLKNVKNALERKRTMILLQVERQKQILEEENRIYREDDLIQIGLPDHYCSNFCVQKSHNILKDIHEEQTRSNSKEIQQILSHYRNYSETNLYSLL